MINKRMLVLTVLMLSGILNGCSTSKDKILPAGNHTMLELWNGTDDSGNSVRQSAQIRNILRRPLTVSESQAQLRVDHSYTRSQKNEITQLFPRLPNPDLVMYLYPHLAAGNTPVPGYSTVFPFYSQIYYAMPGERVEAL